jgi:muramoyltetrapeptide carboxypeptidase
VVLGRFEGAEYEAVEEMVRERLGPLGLPVLAGLPFGHGPDNASLVVGAEAEMDLEAGLLRPVPAVDEN